MMNDEWFMVFSKWFFEVSLGRRPSEGRLKYPKANSLCHSVRILPQIRTGRERTCK